MEAICRDAGRLAELPKDKEIVAYCRGPYCVRSFYAVTRGGHIRITMNLRSMRRLGAALLALTALLTHGVAHADDKDVRTTWQLLDYIAVDYEGAVADRKIVNTTEYAEQQEFAATVATKLSTLPARPALDQLRQQAGQLQQAIHDKESAERVAQLAHALASALLAAYPIPLAPKEPPSIARGVDLYNQTCAACHGSAGDGQGQLAKSLATEPIAFTDRQRAKQRSLFALYQVISQGIDGTPMASFDSLPEADRWALAFRVGQFAYPDELVEQGRKIWAEEAALHQSVPDLKTLVSLTPADLEARTTADKAAAVLAFLRRHPEAVAQNEAPAAANALSVVRNRLAASLEASKAGNSAEARDLALSAYLDGFEPIEPTLTARDATLMARIEGLMLEYRAAVQQGETPEQLGQRQAVLAELFAAAEAVLAPSAGSFASTYLGAATILLREGLEALLIVVAMIAFLRKAERTEVMGYVHAGWISALGAGVVTWAIATWALNISGASRELTEGFGSLLAAAVLLSVGIWMHGKSQADQWQRYIREKMSAALSGRSAWFLFGLAFVVVYREVFETILFYAAMSAQGNGGAMLAGAASAVVVLSLTAWLMLRYSRRLPIGKFFSYSAWLMAVLTVVLAGKGVAALQEAGWIGITPWSAIPRLSMAGIFPTAQTTAAQLAALAALLGGFAWNRRSREA